MRCTSTLAPTTVRASDEPTLEAPTLEDITRIAGEFRLGMSPEQLQQAAPLVQQAFWMIYPAIEKWPEPALPVHWPRLRGRAPHRAENPHNAWAWRCRIDGAADGPLRGWRAAVKDNIAVAEVPMRHGSAALRGFVPDIDATVVTRLLDAGATMLGKAACEDFSFTLGSFSADTGPVSNPYDARFESGGSSSGCAVLVSTEEVDVAVGGDQGGSVRVPAALCGIVGLKPTWGLVPYTGAASLEMTLDHLGPMTRTVGECARVLDVIAGCDGFDPRQYSFASAARPPDYYQRAADAGGDLRGVRIGMLREGFEYDFADPEVVSMVRQAAAGLESRGATIVDLSLPEHLSADLVWAVIGNQGLLRQYDANSVGTNYRGYYFTSLADAVWAARQRGDLGRELPWTAKLNLLLDQWLEDRYSTHFYCKGQNLAMVVRRAYDLALSNLDALLMPTSPVQAPAMPSDAETVAHDGDMMRMLNAESRNSYLGANTAQFDLTGHPAISVPVGLTASRGLPVGMQLVAKQFDERALLRIGACFDSLRGPMPRPKTRNLEAMEQD